MTDDDVCEEKSKEINILPPSKVSVGFSKYPDQEDKEVEKEESEKQVSEDEPEENKIEDP